SQGHAAASYGFAAAVLSASYRREDQHAQDPACVQAGHTREGDDQAQGDRRIAPQPEIQDVADEHEDGAASGTRQEPERRGTQVTAVHTGAIGISRTSPVPAPAPRFAPGSPGRLLARPPPGRVDPSAPDTRCRPSV